MSPGTKQLMVQHGVQAWLSTCFLAFKVEACAPYPWRTCAHGQCTLVQVHKQRSLVAERARQRLQPEVWGMSDQHRSKPLQNSLQALLWQASRCTCRGSHLQARGLHMVHHNGTSRLVVAGRQAIIGNEAAHDRVHLRTTEQCAGGGFRVPGQAVGQNRGSVEETVRPKPLAAPTLRSGSSNMSHSCAMLREE